MNLLHAVWASVLMFLFSGIQLSEGAKILALLNVASPSHHIFNRALMRTLASRGHQVTVLSPDADKDNVPNLTYIQMTGVYDTIKEAFDYEAFAALSPTEFIYTMFDWVSYTCEKGLQSSEAQKLINSPTPEKYELIISEAGWNECVLGLIPKFGSPPVVALSAFGIVPWTVSYMGSPYNPSYMPSFLLPYSSNMPFFQRVYNFFIHRLLIYYYENSHIPAQEAIARKYIKGDMPPFSSIQRNFSIFLANTVFGLESAVPISPNVIPVGGMHIKVKPDPLPKDLQEFLDGAKDGFIFFSLGSNIQSNSLPDHKRRALLEAFSELPQRVLWKFESDNLPGLPSNVKIGKWLPQSDILAHPNIRLFISHCGKMSSTESTYRGVPMVGVPFFVDQILNLELLRTRGVAVRLDYATLSKETILRAIREVVNNNSYQQNMKKLSSIYKDHPESALDRAVFWTEYVIRNGGAPHLRPASTALSWYQYLLLDVLLFIVTLALLFIVLIYLLLKGVINTLRRDSSNKKKTD